jgi:hypothetical protein
MQLLNKEHKENQKGRNGMINMSIRLLKKKFNEKLKDKLG